jgi:hypothetical protein
MIAKDVEADVRSHPIQLLITWCCERSCVFQAKAEIKVLSITFLCVPVEIVVCRGEVVGGLKFRNRVGARQAGKADMTLFHGRVRVPTVVARDVQHLHLTVIVIQQRSAAVIAVVPKQVEVVLDEALNVRWLFAGRREVEFQGKRCPRPKTASTSD